MKKTKKEKRKFVRIDRDNPGLSIKRLWNVFPKMKCIEGCTDCCRGGPPDFSEWERDNIPEHLTEASGDAVIEIDDEAMTATLRDCPYRSECGCTVYTYRPLACRAFGVVEGAGLDCPHGIRPENKISFFDWVEIGSAYLDVSGGKCVKPNVKIAGIKKEIKGVR